MNWMMSNVVAKVDAKDNVYPRKERAENKIDGFVALCSAMGRVMATSDFDSKAFDAFLTNPVIR
jgi:phage terminase large subunit-like protein